MQKTCLSQLSRTLAADTGLCLHTHASEQRMHTCVCVRRPRVSLAFICQKQIYLLIKNCIFHFNISQVNLESDWALNQPQVLEFQQHQGMGAQVVRSTKCNVYSTHTSCMCVHAISTRTHTYSETLTQKLITHKTEQALKQ